jgi:hypothetical protein
VRFLSDVELVDLLLEGLAVDSEGDCGHGDSSGGRINTIIIYNKNMDCRRDTG